MTEIVSRPEDVGHILLKVQEDIQQLREHLISKGDGKSISVADFEGALLRTELGLQKQTEEVVQKINSKVQTLPLGETFDVPDSQRQLISLDSGWDTRIKPVTTVFRHPLPRSGQELFSREPLPPGHRIIIRDRISMEGLTHGQQLRNQILLKAINNPYNQHNRAVLQEHHNIQLPLIPLKPEPRVPPRPVYGGTVGHLTILPKANRIDAQIAPPPITEEDARKGIRNLIERGLIPPAANLTLDPAPVRHRALPLHDPQERSKPLLACDIYAGIKLDPVDAISKSPLSDRSTPKLHLPRDSSSSKTARPTDSSIPKMTLPRHSAMEHKGSRVTSRLGSSGMPGSPQDPDMPPRPLPPPTTPASGDAKSLSHRFAMQHGKVRDAQPEFLVFKQHYCLTWGSIVSILKHLERMLIKYSVPVAFIHGDRLADLSMEFELEKPPGIEDLLSVIVNREDVEAIIKKPGRQFAGPNSHSLAATKIQASWRCHRAQSQYLSYRRQKWAAGVIAVCWIMHIKMANIRIKLRQSRLDQLENSRLRTKKFMAAWDRIKNSKRVVIHIPSLGYSLSIRETIYDLPVLQNSQMARLCDIRDPNVDVIYVSPVPLTDEALQYYSKLLGLHDAILSGKVEDQHQLADRYKILVPDAVKSFPAHRMCLSSILKYSPNTLRRIKNLIRGREAYIVVSVPHKDDLAVADFLDVPILAPEPEVAHLYSTKSGCKRIFTSSGVDMPPGEYDIYSLGQLHECLAQLVTDHLNVKRWLFKLDNEFDGRGIAYCDIGQHLRCYQWAVKEAQRYGDKWSKKWAQEGAYIKIYAEIGDLLEKHAKPVNTRVYATWEQFIKAFLSQGGVIEACPPSDSITTLTVEMLIEPNGQVQLLAQGDQIHADSQFACWGISFPQSSVEPELLNTHCYNIANACKARNIMGYFSIDFVTFIHPRTMKQQLWALDLSVGYSEALALFQLLSFVTHGTLDPVKNVFSVELCKAVQKHQAEEAVNTSRYAVMSTRLFHSNLSIVHYSVFFQMCRAHGIGYDIREKQGTVFTLLDSFKRERLGMISIGDSLQGVLATFARNLSVIHQEISSPKMQGATNFQLAIEDIEGILSTTLQNSEDLVLEATDNESKPPESQGRPQM